MLLYCMECLGMPDHVGGHDTPSMFELTDEVETGTPGQPTAHLCAMHADEYREMRRAFKEELDEKQWRRVCDSIA